MSSKIRAFAAAAKLECETLRSDPVIFEVWPQFVAAGEALDEFVPGRAQGEERATYGLQERGLHLLSAGKNLLIYLAGARVPMPKSTREFLDSCDEFVALQAASRQEPEEDDTAAETGRPEVQRAV